MISGNDELGVYVYSGSGNTVEGNYIGTDVTGTVDLGKATTVCSCRYDGQYDWWHGSWSTQRDLRK